MLFNDLNFILFFVPVLAIFYLLNLTKNKIVKNIFLLTASYIFYAMFDAKFLLLLLYVTMVNFLAIKKMMVNKIENNSYNRNCAEFVAVGIFQIHLFYTK